MATEVRNPQYFQRSMAQTSQDRKEMENEKGKHISPTCKQRYCTTSKKKQFANIFI